jgi:hypothetical protein
MRLEDLGVGQPGARRAGRLALGQLVALDQVVARLAAVVLLGPDVAVAPDLDLTVLRQRVDDRDADAVQAAGDLVAAAVAELAAGVQDGQDDLDGPAGPPSRRCRPGCRGPSSRPVTLLSGWMSRHDAAPKPARASSTGVVDDLVDEVMQPADARRADVHAGALADRLEALEDGDVLGVVGGEPWRASSACRSRSP